MTRDVRFPAALGAVLLALACGPVWAGPFGSEGSMGLSAGYQSNPLLLDTARGSSESLALLLNLPVTYSGSRVTFTLQPSVRAAATRGSVAPLSDYQYVDTSWDYKGERSELSADAAWRRDSTLYNQYERSVLGGNSLRRLEELGSLTWRHQLTERGDFQLQSSDDRVLYDADPTHTLNSYRYGQAGAKFNYSLTERWQGALEGGFTRFDLRDQPYRTDATYAQLDLSRNLSARWSLLMSVGLSRLKSTVTVQEFVLVPDSQGVLHLVPESFDIVSRQSTANYSLDVQRQFERWKLELSGSRALQPSGFGALARQDDVSVKASGDWAERLTVSGNIHGSRLYDASGRLSLGNRRYYDCTLSTTWRWTEHWTLQSQISLYLQRAPPTVAIRSSTALFLTLSRQFGRKSLH